MRASNDPKYQHLQEELHVEITAFAPPAEAHARIAYALTEVRKYLIPDSNDEIRQEQMREMEIMSTNLDGISAAALAAAAGCGTQSASTGAPEVLKNVGVSGPNSSNGGVVQSVGPGGQPTTSPFTGNFLAAAAMHPALRTTTTNTAASYAALASPQSIQSLAVATSPLFRTGFPQHGGTATGLPSSLLAAAAMRPNSVGCNGQHQQQAAAAAMMGSQYTIAAAPLVRSKLLSIPTTSVHQQEILIDAASNVPQATQEIKRDEGYVFNFCILSS